MTDDNTTPEQHSGVDASTASVAEAPAPAHSEADSTEASAEGDVSTTDDVVAAPVPEAAVEALPGETPATDATNGMASTSDATPDTAVVDSVTAEAVAADAVDADAVTGDAVTADAVAADAVGVDSVRADAVPVDAVTADAVTADAVTGDAVTVSAEPAVVEPTVPVFVYQPGDIVPGVISVVGPNGIEADLGDGAIAVIPRAELVGTDEPVVGDAVEGTVTKLQSGTGRYVISPKRAARTRAWARITAAHESGEPVKGTVTSTTKGGLIVDLGIRAFLPESLVDVRRGTNLTSLVGQEVEVVVIEAELLSGERAAVERRGEKVVVNRKMLMGKVRDAQRAEMLASISVGQKFSGPVTAVTDFGAFVDIGGAEGLVHVSELAHRQVRKPSDVVKVGDVIDVVVKEIRGDKGKISLSRKAALPSPWKAFQNVHQVGDLVYGTVTGTAEFGAFVQVEGEGFEPIEGLIHISELSRYRVEQASDVVAVGEGVWTQILSIEPDKRRLALSLRRALEG